MKSILTFGKYKNKHIQEVFAKDKQYIVWLCKQDGLKIIIVSFVHSKNL